jgi:alpha-glucuronidase
VARVYESLDTCPDDLLLFMHHVPYTYKLHSGKTVIQYIYDSHYDGAATAENYVRQWKSLAGRIDEQRYHEVLAQLEYQGGQAQVWRDAVSNWFYRESGIPDAKGRVGHYPGRFEAEMMTLEGYRVTDVMPWEAASGGKAIDCPATQCAASFRYEGKAGWYDLRVEYFDQHYRHPNQGAAHFQVSIADQVVDEWSSTGPAPSNKIDGSTSTRRTIPGVALRPGDTVRIEGFPDPGEAAAIDYVEIQPSEN